MLPAAWDHDAAAAQKNRSRAWDGPPICHACNHLKNSRPVHLSRANRHTVEPSLASIIVSLIIWAGSRSSPSSIGQTREIFRGNFEHSSMILRDSWRSMGWSLNIRGMIWCSSGIGETSITIPLQFLSVQPMFLSEKVKIWNKNRLDTEIWWWNGNTNNQTCKTHSPYELIFVFN